jgi:F0F1-type ATP synthase assembly protein I
MSVNKSTPAPVLDLNRIRRQTLLVATVSVALNVLVFGGIGYGLDLVLDKKPFFLIIGFAVAYVMTTVFVVILSKKLTAKKQKLPYANDSNN